MCVHTCVCVCVCIYWYIQSSLFPSIYLGVLHSQFHKNSLAVTLVFYFTFTLYELLYSWAAFHLGFPWSETKVSYLVLSVSFPSLSYWATFVCVCVDVYLGYRGRYITCCSYYWYLLNVCSWQPWRSYT